MDDIEPTNNPPKRSWQNILQIILSLICMVPFVILLVSSLSCWNYHDGCPDGVGVSQFWTFLIGGVLLLFLWSFISALANKPKPETKGGKILSTGCLSILIIILILTIIFFFKNI